MLFFTGIYQFFVFSCLLVIQLVPFCWSQTFEGCDFNQDVTVGSFYEVSSPNYESNQNYPPGRLCRWTAKTSPGYQLVLSCSQGNFPPSDGCSGDRLQISRSGNKNLADSERYCRIPFYVRSYSNQMVIALLSPPQSRGGRFRCDLYAVRSCDCGRRKQTRIVGGQETLVNEFPSMGAIVSRVTRELYCGATVINEYHALTAAHCVNSNNRNASQILLLVGDHDYTTGSETPYAAVYEIYSAVRHSAYSGEKDINDIAILTTYRAMVFNAGVGPVCLPFRYRRVSFVGRRLEALGWGTTSFTAPASNRLMKVLLDVVEQSRCEAAYPDRITSAQICTYSPGKDTCNYDSGGPLMFTDPTNDNTLYQIGITSYGQACAASNPSVSTKVADYLDWIRQNAPYANFCEK